MPANSGTGGGAGMKHTAPLVSVIIPTYNRADLLQRALASVRAQTHCHWEAMVIDDHSEDDTVERVLALKDPRIRLLSFRSGGVIAASRNYGIQESRGTVIAFLDSDDAWFPDKLERCLDAMRKTQADVVGHGVVCIRDGQPWKRQLSGPAYKATYERLLYGSNCLTTSAVMVNRDCLARVQGFYEEDIQVAARERRRSAMGLDEEHPHVGSEDYDLWLRLARAGARFAFVDEMLGEYHFHSGNAGKSVWCHINSELAVLRRHFSADRAVPLAERWRRRRRRALVFYAGARAFHDEGLCWEALRLYWKTARVFPFIPKLYAAAGLLLCRRVLPRSRAALL